MLLFDAWTSVRQYWTVSPWLLSTYERSRTNRRSFACLLSTSFQSVAHRIFIVSFRVVLLQRAISDHDSVSSFSLDFNRNFCFPRNGFWSFKLTSFLRPSGTRTQLTESRKKAVLETFKYVILAFSMDLFSLWWEFWEGCRMWSALMSRCGQSEDDSCNNASRI